MGRLGSLPWGHRDICDRFVIPEKLYGRETEVKALLEAFDRISEGSSEIMLVAGFSGIGKTAVVNEVHKPIVRQRGYFIKGKFDQFKRDIPFSSWVQAFQNLIRQLLTENAAEVQKWQVRIVEALGENGQVIMDVIPELERLIGKQPEVPELEGNAAQNRFNLLFQKFIRVFATKEHPLVIFLDDLQWADSASLKLMQLLMSETDTRYLLLMGAYRDNEVFPAHPLMLTLDEIRKESATVNQITLSPLDQPSLNRLIADTLSCPPERAIPLTELVFAKTKGNPFFATQFLKSLQVDGLISFDFNSGYWQCDIAQVKALALTDDVVEFMAIQLQKLPVNTQEVLKLGACIGNEFDLATLAIVHEKSQAETAADLWKALQEGLVIPITEVYKFFHDSESVAVAQASDLSVPYKFLHDRVQQAAYSLIPESQKQSTHLEIGRMLLHKGGPGGTAPTEAERENKIFDIVNQLNIGKELMTYRTERDELAQLNLIAGRKAKASTAYAAAQKYLTVGLELIAADSWESQYGLTLALYEEAAEAAYLNGHFDEMDKLVDIVLQKAKSLLEKVKVYSVKIQGTVAQGNLKKAIKIGLKVSELLGVILPEEPSQLDVQRGLEETASLLEGQEIENLINLPEMTDPQKLAAINILTSITSAAFIAAPDVCWLVVLSKVNLSIKYGNATYSGYAYGAYGIFSRAALQNIESSYKLGKLALSLVERLNAKNVKAKVLLSFGGHLRHWKDHLRESIPVLIEGYQSGVETGDFQYAGYCAAYVCECSYLIGHELTGLEQQITIYSKAINQIGQEGPFNWTAIFWQVVLNLLGKAEDPIRLMGDAYNQEQALPRAIKVNNRIELLFIYSNQLILCYLFGEVQQAVNNATLAKQYLEGLAGMPVVSAIYLYESLAYLCLFVEASDAEKEALLNRVNANQEKMLQWADHAPMNYVHKFYLVEAERYRVLGENMEAMEMYDRAIKLAQENEYINEEALANELAAKFYLDWGKEKIAQVYLTDAYYAYARWGAKAKIDDLEKRYPQLLAPILNQKTNLKTGETIAQMMITGTVASTSSGVSEILDLATVIKASQSLSGEINLDKLLSTLMQVMIENAGAETGAMILIERDSFLLAAQCAIGKSYNLHSTPVVDSQEIPIAIINYVSRTQETLVINDATTEATFAADSYIIQHQPKSVLCLPIQHQGKPIAILYLENNLVTNAFTPDRLAVLNILASQAAISIENAQLYANLETKVEERTQELSEALNNLKSTQEELIQSEKMAALGQLVAGVAHEINTPLGAICSSVGYISDFLNQNLNQLPSFFQSLSPQRQQQFIEMLERSQQNTTTVSGRERRQLRKAIVSQLQAQGMTEADSVANLLLDLGICDRLEPLISIFQDAECENFLKTVRQFVRLQESTRDIKIASERAAKIVFALKTYARFNQTGETVEANIIDGIEVVLTLYQNQLKQGVEVIRKYQDLPRIRCYFDELNQVWTNLIHNGLQAMNNRGILTIEAREQNGSILVSVTDSGEGIPEEIKPKIFQPFFTTKPPGEGSGLGLDIVRRIVEKHRGIIEFESIPGQTTFTVSLPINS
ncbi:MAG: AAA family ATPase [Microcoleus sp.]